MKQQNTIAIIGAAERRGQEFVKHLLDSDHHLLLVARNQEELRLISKLLKGEKPIAGISLVDCIKDGCWEADVVVLAVPDENEIEVARRIREVVTQKIVISMKTADTIPGNSLQKLLPNAKVVNAIARRDKEGKWKLIISGENISAVKEASQLFIHLNIQHTVAA